MGNAVGILTYHRAYNFGAVLQAFALQRTIAALGHECSIVDYRAPDERASYPVFRLPRDRSSLSADVLLAMNLAKHLRSRRRYESFRATHLAMTPQAYHSGEEVRRVQSRFGAFVSGSDQIWHPGLMSRPGGPVFFQEFVGQSRRVAYAPSFGVTEIPPQQRDRIRQAIGRFDFLSAREESGCELIRRLTGRTAEHVVDPTLLQGPATYDRVAQPADLAEPYVLVYATEHSNALRELAVRIRARLKLPIVAVLPWYFAPWRYAYADRRVYDAGPAEFLGWMKGAAFVCTNSFHGMCLSVLYEKPFLGVPHGSTGTRQVGLLKLLGLSSRLVSDPEAEAVQAPLEWTAVQERLRGAAARSMDYLAGALA